MKAVQVILGHSTATMTMDLYGHLFSEATWQAMERLPVIPLMQAPRAIEQREARYGRRSDGNPNCAGVQRTVGGAGGAHDARRGGRGLTRHLTSSRSNARSILGEGTVSL